MGRIDRPSIIRVDCAVNRGSISSLHFGRCCLGLSVRLHGPKVTFDNLPVNALQTAPVTWGPAGLCWSLTKPSHISPYCVVILVCFYSALRLQPKKLLIHHLIWCLFSSINRFTFLSGKILHQLWKVFLNAQWDVLFAQSINVQPKIVLFDM